jgi:hypothetical protein
LWLRGSITMRGVSRSVLVSLSPAQHVKNRCKDVVAVLKDKYTISAIANSVPGLLEGLKRNARKRKVQDAAMHLAAVVYTHTQSSHLGPAHSWQNIGGHAPGDSHRSPEAPPETSPNDSKASCTASSSPPPTDIPGCSPDPSICPETAVLGASFPVSDTSISSSAFTAHFVHTVPKHTKHSKEWFERVFQTNFFEIQMFSTSLSASGYRVTPGDGAFLNTDGEWQFRYEYRIVHTQR